LLNKSEYGFYNHTDLVTVAQHSTLNLRVKTGEKVDTLTLDFEVLNALTSPKTKATLRLEVVVDTSD